MFQRMGNDSARGYFGVAVYRPKNSVNIGSLFRTAQLLGASYLAVIGARYKRQPSDTYNAAYHMPLYQYDGWDDFRANIPLGTRIVAVELTPDAQMLDDYEHPKQAVYLLGAEDNGIPVAILERCHDVVKLRGKRSMNVAVAGSIVLYSRGLCT